MPYALPEAPPEVRDAATTLLRELAAGESVSVDALFPLVYD